MTAPLLDPAPPGVFRPVAVESPGGGRVQDKRDPVPQDIVNVQGLNRPIPLHRLAAQAWSALLSAARRDGIAAPLMLPVSGYRSGAHQERLWQRALARYGSPAVARRWVAPPGSSAHQSGRAIDFHLGMGNDSANVARLRTTPAFRWLVANAQRFGFYPYEQEPWHWEYNPPSGDAPPPGPASPPPGPSSPLRAGAVRAGELQVPSVPVLAGHRGRAPALMLAWNDMPSVPAELDVVVHLHGYARPQLSLQDDIRPVSGLDLAPVDGAAGRGRSRPTLTILPRGHDTGQRQRNGSAHVYTFPAIDGTDGRRDGLTRLIAFSLQQFAARAGGSPPRAGRLILTAHSGGGQPLLRILRFTDPHEVHAYDALYWPADALADWAARHHRQRSGAMRVFYRADTGTEGPSRRLRDALGGRLGGAFRVEASTLGHFQIPRTYGWRVLADPSADVPGVAGSGGRPQRPRARGRTSWPGQLVPLLDRHRGDIPLDFLLGWIDVESGGRISVVTSLDERGFFQIHPDESRDRRFDHQRLSRDPDYSVQAGIENVRYYADLARRRFPSIPPGTDTFWRVVKLQHALGSPLTRRLLDGMRADGIALTWDAIKRYEISHGPQLHRLLRVRPGRFGHNVDETLKRGRALAAALGR